MKNKLFKFLILVFLSFLYQAPTISKELEVKSSQIKIDKTKKTVILNGNVSAKDENNNIIKSEKANYNKIENILDTTGKTEVITSNGFKVLSSDVRFDNKQKVISSSKNTTITDRDGNQITLTMFNYIIEKNMFFSKGQIKVIDVNKNDYNFSEIYIDEKKNKIVGSDVKFFINQRDVKYNEENEPRFFANSVSISKDKSEFNKGVFTYCKNQGEDKSPAWCLKSKKITHNSAKKTIYYDNAVLKIYDFPIFYFPFLAHPDPTVKRRSGLLQPTLTDNSNVGPGISLPYFWAISKDKDLTLTPKLYTSENPLLMAEYRQDFEKSFLIVDTGFSDGYRKTSSSKTSGSRSHFFSNFQMDLSGENEKSNIEFNIQRVSNDTYLKIHDVDSILANERMDVLENTFLYDYQKDDVFFGASFSAFESLTKANRTRYEYLVPYLTYDKNLLMDDKYGIFDLSSKFRIKNYEVNKQTEIFTNDILWKSNKWINKFGIENQFKGLIKATNYSADNASEYKTDHNTYEFATAIGHMSKLAFYKDDLDRKNNHLFVPKMFIRYAPGHMRDVRDESEYKLDYSNLFDLQKVNAIDIVEDGLSASLGFDYKINKLNNKGEIKDEKFSLSMGQVISEKDNLDMPSSTSMDQRFSDIVGESKYKLSDNINLNYNFAIDQSYNDLNYNEIGADILMNKAKFNISYLEEKNHIGNQEYIKTDFDINLNDSNVLTLSTKRNLLTNSAEFYNLSYSYMNDCLKAGIVFRREFYTDRDIEPDNSLMFKISVIPFGEIRTPKVSK